MSHHSLEVIQPVRRIDPSEDRVAAIARELSPMIEGEVRTGRHERMLYATDASIYQVEPLAVVIPKSVDDVRRTVKYAAERDLPILPRGGGTSLAGQTVNAALVIDFSVHCQGLLEVDESRRRARLEPGVVLDHFNDQLAEYGLMFGPDVATSSHANLGGMIGNNSAGAHSVKYGRTVEHVHELKVLLADGSELSLYEGAAEENERVAHLTAGVAEVVQPLAEEIRRRYPKTRRRVDGYNLDLFLDQLQASTLGTFDRVNLSHLICGSEGTLAVVTEATVGLVDRPGHIGLAIAAYPSLSDALNSLAGILETDPAAVELIDDVIINLAARNTEYRRYVELLPRPEGHTPAAVLYVEYFADDEAELTHQFENLSKHAGSSAIQRYTDPPSMAAAWKLRKAGEPLLHGLPGNRKPITFIEDTAVAPERLPEFVCDFREIIERHGTIASYYAHASVGCLHIRPLVDPHDAADRRLMQTIAEEVTDLVVRYEGALSGEHGDGRIRSPLLRRYFGDEICDAFSRIKRIFDPEHRLNPGNIVEPEPMTEHMRVRPKSQDVRVPDDVETFYTYQREEGFGHAVELCNGAGVCRRMKGGVMCPSYRATRDERHATRGRGNALRLAITGQFTRDTAATDSAAGPPAWNDPETLTTLDLCLSCKACKSECPSNVDIAKLKAEYQGQRFRQRGGAPLVTRLFGRVRTLNRIGSAVHPIANALNRFPPVRWLINRAMKIHPRRSLPSFSQSLYHWFAERGGAKHSAESPTVVLLPDCFTVYNESHIGRSAINVLEALGYHVVLPKLGCCGRSMISLGLLDEAIATCSKTAEDLLACAQGTNAVAVVGIEPSCISAIRDDWMELKLNVERDRIAELAERTMLIDEFIDQEWGAHPVAPALKDSAACSIRSDSSSDSALPGAGTPRFAKRLTLHTHCHQKALWGAESSAALLRRVVAHNQELDLRVLDSGCCGMAGSFGYARHRYDLSMRIGELSVFGPFREQPDAVALVTGTSCRHQIYDATGIAARHPIEAFEEWLDFEKMAQVK